MNRARPIHVRSIRALCVTWLVLASALPAQAELELSRLVGDGMVVQRDAPVPIRGWATPGAAITVTLDGTSRTAHADTDGAWSVELPARGAGGPFTLTVEGDSERRTIRDVLVGDVWLCSGQSNMAWTVADSLDFEAEAAAATDRAIRHFHVPLAAASRPAERLDGGEWVVTSPDTVGDFTAVGYFFARELRRHVDVPIGLVHSSWGGSRIEPWTSAAGLGYDSIEQAARAVERQQREEGARRLEALREALGELPTEDPGFDGDDAPWADPALDDSDWTTMTLPTRWESAGYPGLDGIVWFRRDVELSAEEAASAVALHLGQVDDGDITWVNGRRVGGLDRAWNVPRVYPLDAGVLRAGRNTIAVRVEDTGAGGGLLGPADELHLELGDGTRSLVGDWRFRVGEFRFDPESSRQEFPMLLYNRMIHPLRHTPIRGALWYQGESNTAPRDARAYRRRLAALIEDWRAIFPSGDFPFLVVQLANFNPAVDEPSDSQWAEVREAQAAALDLPMTGLAVTIDIGEGDDIHPRNKQDVGRRLALAARRVAYGETLVDSGPTYRSHAVRGDEIVVTFDHVGGGLVTRDGPPREFAIAGADLRFARAEARVEGDQVVLSSAAVPEPVAVRYAWADNPEHVNLYNAEGLPAVPFRTDSPPAYLDPSQPVDVRARDLVSRMTLEEKIAQSVHDAPAIERLEVPEYDWWNETLHGVGRAGRATVFPQAIGLGATFDTELIGRVATAISDEARAKHHAATRLGRRGRYQGLTFWTPNVNLFRDPRWGRGQETYGEDPFLMSEIGATFVRGLQGDHERYMKVAACAKHFVVHSGPEGERHVFDAVATPKDMEESYFPAFRALVEADVEAVMCAYNRTNGEPCCGSEALLQDLLRDTWGFDGHVVSDCWAIRDFDEHHKVTRDNAESAALAMKSGTNLNCGDSFPSLAEAVDRGLITEEEIDASLATLLATRFRLGLFDPELDNPYTRIPIDVVDSPEHRALAREAAVESLVLLKNDGVLPLRENPRKVYVTGPLAADAAVLLGNYHGVSGDLVTVLEGVVEAADPATLVTYRQGSLLDRENVNPIDWFSGVATDSDVTIAVMGISNLLEGEEGAAIASPGKGDRFDLDLPANQLSFLRTLREKAPKLVVVLFGGSPMTIAEVHDMADAVLLAWYPGAEGGRAIADVLFGHDSPSGRLPITFPKSLDQLPPYEEYSMVGRTYRYMTEEPLYPFGFGLSYTTFAYRAIELSSASIAAGDSVTVSVTVENTGEVAAEEVVQLYVTDLDASVRVPRASLRGFRRVALDPGARVTVDFVVGPDDLELVNEAGDRVLEPGRFAITVGGASPGARAVALGAPESVRAELTVE